MKAHLLTTDELDRWGEYYDRLQAKGVYHSPRYLSILEGDFEFEDERAELFVLEDGDEFVYYPYIRRPLDTVPGADEVVDTDRYFDAVSSWYYGGPIASDPNASDVVSAFGSRFGEHCRDEGIVAEFVRFDPNIENHLTFRDLEPEFNRKTVYVDLTKSKETIWDEFTSSNRTHIRQAQDAGITVQPAADHSDVAAFHEIYQSAMDAKDASQHYRFPASFFSDLVSPHDGIGTLLVSRYEDEIVGGSLLVHDDTTVNEYVRASDPEYWDLGLNNFLCYRAIWEMHGRGYDRLDFQGGRPGVFDFKKAFSPERGAFHVATRTHIEDVYRSLTDAAREHGVEVDTGYFPAYRVEQSN